VPDLLLELLSEEIPARMQSSAARDLERLVIGALSDRGLLFEGVKSFGGARRLTLVIANLAARQPDVTEERKGPRVGAPEKAIEGFLRSAGVPLDSCQKQNDGKGEFYVATILKAGRPAADVLAEILPPLLSTFPWPKSMRWTDGPVRWVRPLHSILCVLDGEIVPFEFADVTSGNTTLGHHFLSQGPIEIHRFEDYEEKLAAAHVVLDVAERKAIILHEAEQNAFSLGLELNDDPGLLEEVGGLVEWPVVLLGTIDQTFMDMPAEVLRTSMRTHQKYFSMRNPRTGDLANRFVAVANTVATDGGADIVAGNERVLRARLSDAKFFWEQDRKRRLADRVADLDGIVFHAKVGTLAGHANRIALVAAILAERVGADVAKCIRAAQLAKADLVTQMVGEFPELQGVMGYYYALHDGEDGDVACAIRDHYKPLGPNDTVPESPVAAIVALSDKIVSLTSLWNAGERPTGSKDPFALRRAGLGIIRTMLQHRFRLPMSVPIGETIAALGEAAPVSAGPMLQAQDDRPSPDTRAVRGRIVQEILDFLADRLKVILREEGIRHDLIDAVFSLGGEDDLVRLVARVKALAAFLTSEDGTNLIGGYRRATNILRIEEKRDGRPYDEEPQTSLLREPAEHALFSAMSAMSGLVARDLAAERFEDAMTQLATLRGPVDAFFDKVTVNADDPQLRANRLFLLSRLRATLHQVADFAKIEG
jgi:glycyl-tRNA synthetase beta chain